MQIRWVFTGGGGVGQVRSSTRQSVPYVNFKVAVLEFAYRWRYVALDSLKKILDTWQWLCRAYTLQLCIYCVALWLTYLLTCPRDLSAVQYELLRNDPSVKNVTSLTSLVSHTYSPGLREATVKFINLSCLLYPLAVLAVNEPSVNFASWKTSCAVRWEMNDTTVWCWWQWKRTLWKTWTCRHMWIRLL